MGACKEEHSDGTEPTPGAASSPEEVLVDQLIDLQSDTPAQMTELGPDPAQLVLGAGIRATLEAVEQGVDQGLALEQLVPIRIVEV